MGELTGGVQFILFQGSKSDSRRYIQSQDVCELNRTESLTPIFASLFYIVMPKFRRMRLLKKLHTDAAGLSPWHTVNHLRALHPRKSVNIDSVSSGWLIQKICPAPSISRICAPGMLWAIRKLFGGGISTSRVPINTIVGARMVFNR